MANDPGDDRRWIIEQWQYLYGRLPTAEEVNRNLTRLQGGMTRTAWMTMAERVRGTDSVRRLYQDALGRDPSPQMLAYWTQRLQSGTSTRADLQKWLTSSTEALLREPEEPPDPNQENARDYLNSVLEGYGLSGMGDWAWEQIQQGYTNERILQNLRETDTYKQRFVGMEARKAAGLPAISEAEYIEYERGMRQTMHAAGLPPDFYDQPQDFADFIGKDISVAEMQERINNGYLAASQAPAEVRAQLRELYGIDEGALAAFFLDPDRALPVIQRQYQAASISGAGVRTGYGALSAGEAEGLAALGVSDQEAQQGFASLAESAELFAVLPGEQEGLIDREDQLAAVFGGDAEAGQRIERKAGARRAAGSGAQSFTLGQEGISGLSRR